MLILQIFLPANAITSTLSPEKCKSVVFLPDYIEQALFKYAASPHSTCNCNYRSNGFLYNELDRPLKTDIKYCHLSMSYRRSPCVSHANHVWVSLCHKWFYGELSQFNFPARDCICFFETCGDVVCSRKLHPILCWQLVSFTMLDRRLEEWNCSFS